ncbi:TetR family transcriptional regulator [Sneathiella sp. P13V-1]|uniref:TetR/AcrR family transcriptional regulator n=1 Tax=Sneathiella sp. P13V-1 TaxID=2697366 RepID=UPI00187B59A7|nr:TetR/AcrR family transcriptional regulator [Sneathiella sp. P13V-1]MBE7636244.1 TetR family transcriptional regulator [Sneathiella sp. P13V-1]
MTRTKKQHRTRILQAAQKRFLNFGYTKTTTEDIASDCQISPAHLYNHFKNKLDLAIAVAEHEEQELQRELKAHLSKEGYPEENLERYFREEMILRKAKRRDHPGYQALLEVIEKKRPAAIEGFRHRLLKDISLYLDRVIQQGALQKTDPFRLAEMFHLATYPFRFQAFFLDRSEEELERDLNEIVALVYAGAQKKRTLRRESGGSGLS